VEIETKKFQSSGWKCFWGAHPPRVWFDAPRVGQNPADEASGGTREGARAPHLQMVAVRKNLDLVWVWVSIV
jgi:hypothetical protein